MDSNLKNRAEEIISILNDLPQVNGCTIYGSLLTNTHDDKTLRKRRSVS